MDLCFSSGLAKGYILYNPTVNKEVIPEMITLAGVLDSVPFNSTESVPKGLNGSLPPLSFNVETKWDGYDSFDAVNYLYGHYIQ